MPIKESSLQIDQKMFTVRTGQMARQASGAVTVRVGDTIVLVTVCGSKKPRENGDFLPLTVDYVEKTSAGGYIPGGFFKREGRATEKEILTSRLTDRPIRPLFPKGYCNEVQIIAQVLSADGDNNPDILAINGASLALVLSDIPFLEPIAAVRVCEIDGNFVVNPTYEETRQSSLDLMVAGTKDGITMIESVADEISEDRMIEALEFAHANVVKLVEFQVEFSSGIAKEKKIPAAKETNEELIKKIRSLAEPRFAEINQAKSKQDRDAEIDILNQDIIDELVTEGSEATEGLIKTIVHDVEYETVRDLYLSKKVRVDGRKLDEIREITSEVGILPRVHGSALFTRGQTQSLSITTLGTSRDEQTIETYEGPVSRNFLLHYNFPPFSVGEVRMMRGPGRREIGHGNLACRGLTAVMPKSEEFPYTVRLVSEILESNGSSSMASVCAGSLALMDAGVPIKSGVSGIAMGLIQDNERFAVLSDIAGVEDHLGDMDFKVAGTKNGITTLQLDIKLKEGLRFEILRQAIDQANKGRAHILDRMNTVLDAPKKSLSQYAPRITTLRVPKDKIGGIIGPGGKVIRKMSEETGATIEIDDDGTIMVASNNEESSKKAIQMINGIIEEPEVGKVYDATVARIMNFGVFCEFLPGREGLCHVSELSEGYLAKVEDAVQVGDKIKVKLIEIDSQGRLNLSRTQVNTEGVRVPAPRKRPQDNREDRKGSRPPRSRH